MSADWQRPRANIWLKLFWHKPSNIVDFLLSHGAVPTQNGFGETPKDNAKQAGASKCVAKQEGTAKCLSMLDEADLKPEKRKLPNSTSAPATKQGKNGVVYELRICSPSRQRKHEQGWM